MVTWAPADVAAREREGGETPNREGELEEEADREKWKVREKHVLGRGVKENETGWTESREKRANWLREWCGGNQ